MSLVSKIISCYQGIEEEQIQLRRDIYQHPELSGKEERTAKLIYDTLKEEGIQVQLETDEHSVLGTIQGRGPGPVVVLRADIDALLIQDMLELSYRSKVPNVKHGCGHDVHTAVAIGTAKILHRLKEQWRGTIKLVFQPEEETICGAKKILKKSFLDDAEAVFAYHVFPVEVGKVVIGKENIYSCCHTYFTKLTVSKEKQSQYEGAEKCFLEKINHMSSKYLEGSIDKKVSLIEKIEGQTENLFYCDVKLRKFETKKLCIISYTFQIKASSEEQMEYALEKIKEWLSCELKYHGVDETVQFTCLGKIPSVYNDPVLVDEIETSVEEVIGKENILHVSKPVPFFVEDFAYYAQKKKAALLFLGIQDKNKELICDVHTPEFNVDEQCLRTGTIVMINLLVNYCESKIKS